MLLEKFDEWIQSFDDVFQQSLFEWSHNFLPWNFLKDLKQMLHPFVLELMEPGKNYSAEKIIVIEKRNSSKKEIE